jgi:hypothetical protein
MANDFSTYNASVMNPVTASTSFESAFDPAIEYFQNTFFAELGAAIAIDDSLVLSPTTDNPSTISGSHQSIQCNILDPDTFLSNNVAHSGRAVDLDMPDCELVTPGARSALVKSATHGHTEEGKRSKFANEIERSNVLEPVAIGQREIIEWEGKARNDAATAGNGNNRFKEPSISII